jgi:multisubunit Na+/H+ antiporter MnhG subunit
VTVRERYSRSTRDWRPLVLRTSGNATHGVYGLILATAVITISRELDSSDAGRAALNVLVTALVFWLAHVYARLLGQAVSRDESWSRGGGRRGDARALVPR